MIIAFCGKKQSGKGTAHDFIALINSMCGVDTREFFFAEPLKRMCVDILGLRVEQAFGSNEEKDTAVEHLLWENFPVPAYDMPDGSAYVQAADQPSARSRWLATEFPYGHSYVLGHKVAHERSLDPYYPTTYLDDGRGPKRKRGPMTGREVLQYWGTEITRRAYPNVWADACIRQVRKWEEEPTLCKAKVAVITDCRFPNEVDAVQGAGGLVVRLTRNPYDDRHISEVALDPEQFDHGRFDFINDNAGMGPAESCLAMHPFLLEKGVVGKVSQSYLDVVLASIEGKGQGVGQDA